MKVIMKDGNITFDFGFMVAEVTEESEENFDTENEDFSEDEEDTDFDEEGTDEWDGEEDQDDGEDFNEESENGTTGEEVFGNAPVTTMADGDAEGVNGTTDEGADGTMDEGTDGTMDGGADGTLGEGTDGMTDEGADMTTGEGADGMTDEGTDGMMDEGAGDEYGDYGMDGYDMGMEMGMEEEGSSAPFLASWFNIIWVSLIVVAVAGALGFLMGRKKGKKDAEEEI